MSRPGSVYKEEKMEITAVNPLMSLFTDRTLKTNSPKSFTDSPLFTAEAVTFERQEANIEIAVYTSQPRISGAVPRVLGAEIGNSPQIQESQTTDEKPINQTAETAQLKQAIHAEVLAQVKDFLGAYFKEHPEDVEKISRGEIPDYFNVDNTARRILDIYFSRYQEGEDKGEFVKRAKGIIEQAYGDVEKMVGTLPDIVQKTREKVMEILDNFAQGGDISDFMSRKIA